MRPSFSLATSLATSLLAVYMAQPVYALDGALPAILMGCYSSNQGMALTNSSILNSSGFCQGECFPLGKAVMAMTGGNQCWCGDEMPNLSTKVDDSNCAQGCDAYPADKCGSPKGLTPVYWSVWNSGVQSVIINNQTSASSSSSSTSGTATSTSGPAATAPGQTVVVTASSTSAPTSGPNTAGIAAGVVVGIIAIAAIGGGVWFYMRAKARRELEEEHKRQATVNAFIASGKPGSSAGSSHDTRLDPVIMTQRRMSDGSIADNQDYSRRILKVTNA